MLKWHPRGLTRGSPVIGTKTTTQSSLSSSRLLPFPLPLPPPLPPSPSLNPTPPLPHPWQPIPPFFLNRVFNMLEDFGVANYNTSQKHNRWCSPSMSASALNNTTLTISLCNWNRWWVEVWGWGRGHCQVLSFFLAKDALFPMLFFTNTVCVETNLFVHHNIERSPEQFFFFLFWNFLFSNLYNWLLVMLEFWWVSLSLSSPNK